MSNRLSAFAALNNSSDSDPNSDNDIITYEEDDIISDKSVIKSSGIKVDLGFENISSDYGREVASESVTPIVCSNFKHTHANTVYNDDHLIIGLNNSEYILIKGQYILTVQKGSIVIDSIVYHSNPNVEIKINASSISALPLISCNAFANSLKTNDFKNSSNEKLFDSNFKSILLIKNFYNGFESFPLLYPSLKNIYPSKSLQYSFKVVLKQEPLTFANSIPNDWKTEIDAIISTLSKKEQSKFLIIGPKNSGKSTFLRILMNNLILNKYNVQVLDIDPGQPEFSPPNCISLTKHNKPTFGTTIPPYSFEDNSNESDSFYEFIGFNTPQIQPLKYIAKLNNLITISNLVSNSNADLDKNMITLINSPGWIKGFGIEIIKNVIEKSNVDHLVQLCYGNKDLEIIESIKYIADLNITKLPAIFLENMIMYSPSQIRNFKLLSYLHYSFRNSTFNFNPLLLNSPLRLSYSSENSVEKLLKFSGLIAISMLDSKNLNSEDLVECLECQVLGIFAVNTEEFHSVFEAGIKNNLQCLDGLPNLIKDDDILDDVEMEFLGLCAIHSIDKKNNLLNIYTPIDTEDLKLRLIENKIKLLMTKGKLELPIEEIYPRSIFDQQSFQKEQTVKLEEVQVPYIVSSITNNDMKGSKVTNVRRNIMRRSQHG